MGNRGLLIIRNRGLLNMGNRGLLTLGNSQGPLKGVQVFCMGNIIPPNNDLTAGCGRANSSTQEDGGSGFDQGG